jgi:hypothetical protein
VIFVVEADSYQFLRMRDGSAKGDVRLTKEITVYAARRSLQMSQLLFQQLQSILDLQYLFDGKYDSRELQEVVANCFCEIKACIPENAPEAHHIGRGFPGKVHEFQIDLL